MWCSKNNNNGIEIKSKKKGKEKSFIWEMVSAGIEKKENNVDREYIKMVGIKREGILYNFKCECDCCEKIFSFIWDFSS